MNKLHLSKLFYNKKFLVAFSAVLAVILWLVIYINENPMRETTINNVPISISLKNSVVEELGLDIVGSLDQTVSVTVSGPNYVVSSVTADDILVNVSISNVNTAGSYKLELVAAKNSGKSGYTILGVSPSSVEVDFDYYETKIYTVEPIAIGASAVDLPGYEAKSAQVTNVAQSTLEVKGPKSVVEKIAKVQAVCEVNAVLDKTTSYDATLKFLDEDGNAVDSTYLTYPEEKYSITVPIYKKVTLPIVPAFTNTPEGYLGSVPCTLSETTVTVEGAPEMIDTLTEIKLKPIDFSSITTTQTSFEAALDLPSAIKCADNLETVTVKLSLGQLRERTFNVGEISGTALSDGLTATFDTLKNVKICGNRTTVNRLSSTDLYAVADLSTITASGTYTVPVQIKCKSSNGVWAIGSYNVTVKVK